jgi:hypothetical protein
MKFGLIWRAGQCHAPSPQISRQIAHDFFRSLFLLHCIDNISTIYSLREKVLEAGGVVQDKFSIGKCFACLQVVACDV